MMKFIKKAKNYIGKNQKNLYVNMLKIMDILMETGNLDTDVHAGRIAYKHEDSNI